ncbi:MAG: histidine phosphatase family protein [Thermodesulfobacteriota bacterium]
MVGYINRNGLASHAQPPPELFARIEDYKSIVCSDLPRSIESADLLSLNKNRIIDKLFREAELPAWNHSGIRLPPVLWTAFLRTLWFTGYSSGCASMAETKSRAAQAAQALSEMAEKNRSVIFVGHGFLNRYIAKELLADGWCGPSSPLSGYWSLSNYTKRH